MDSQSVRVLAELENEQMDVDREETEAELQGAHSETQVTQPTKTVFQSNKRLKADVWKEYIPVGVGIDGKNRGRCIYCSKELVIDVRNGTSSLKRHLEICPVKPESDGNAEKKYDPKVDREMTSELIIYHDLPFRYVEYEKVRARDRYLNPKCVHICRQTAAADVFRKYEMEKAKLKKLFANLKSRVCFTADLWSARTVMGYICLTAHYIDDGWTLNNKILAFCEIKPPHTGDEIAKKVLGCLKEWGLEKKVFSFTLDNATSNTSMQKILSHRLQMVAGNRLPCNGKFLHVRCCAHILNLIVKEGLELAYSLLENIRESVRFVKASQSRKDSFAACVESLGITDSSGLSLDVSTRWNSTYDMLVRALKFRRAFASFKVCDRSYNTLPSEQEWERGQKICDFLKPFSTITTYFSGVKYPTANIYFIQVWNIELLLRKYADCDDEDLRLMARRMQIKFAKYWDEYSVILAMGAILDPRFKIQILRKAFDRLDPTTSEKKVEVIVKNLKDLYEEYMSKPWTSSSSSSNYSATPDDLLNESPLEDNLNSDLFELERSIQHGSDNTKTSLELYLEEPRLELKAFADIEVLSYWKENGHRHGDLAALAMDLLSIPITTVASESAFSIGGRVLTPYRNRLLPDNVQALLCTRNWLRGYPELEGDIEDNVDEEATNVASSSGV